MKVFKSIFRIDYKLSFSLVDKLGEHLELIHLKTQEAPFSNGVSNLDIGSHSITHRGKCREDVFNLLLSLTNFNSVIEHQSGVEIKNLAKHPVFKLADEVVEKLGFETFKSYDRIGIRMVVLAEDPKLKFERILKFFRSSNNLFDSIVERNFRPVDDAALVLESKNAVSGSMRIQVGPYSKVEEKRYFSLEPNVEEALMLDVDFWQNNVAIPGFKLSAFVKAQQDIASTILSEIAKQVVERV